MLMLSTYKNSKIYSKRLKTTPKVHINTHTDYE